MRRALLGLAIVVLPSLARADASVPDQVLEADARLRVTVRGADVLLEPTMPVWSQTCLSEPRVSVEERGALREANTRLPPKGGYFYRGKRAGYGSCDYVTCQPSGPATVPLREYRQRGERDGAPVYEDVPLAGRIHVEVPWFSDAHCTQRLALHATVLRRPRAEEPRVDPERIVAAIARAGYANPEVLGRAPDGDDGPQVLATATRDGATRVLFLHADRDGVSAPLELAHGAHLVAVFAPPLGELAQIEVSDRTPPGSRSTLFLVADGPPPRLRCSLPGGAVRPAEGHVTYRSVTLEPVAGGFRRSEVRQLDGAPATRRDTDWKLDDKGCAEAR